MTLDPALTAKFCASIDSLVTGAPVPVRNCVKQFPVLSLRSRRCFHLFVVVVPVDLRLFIAIENRIAAHIA